MAIDFEDENNNNFINMNLPICQTVLSTDVKFNKNDCKNNSLVAVGFIDQKRYKKVS